MNEDIKKVWAAAACMESLQAEMDQAQAALTWAVAEAVLAGAALESIGEAANLSRPELGRRVRLAGAPAMSLAG